MFSVPETARAIRNARLAKNLTQMDVADALGVSYQAVSNWERGNSMPDIGKLEDLSRLLEITIEELLHQTDTVGAVKKVLEAEPHENADLDLSEIADISPLLPPQTAAKLTEKAVDSNGGAIEIWQLCSLAPYLSSESVESLAEGVHTESIEELVMLAPFISRETADRMVDGLHAESVQELAMLAPFISREITDRMVDGLHAESVEELVMLAPFISREITDRMVEGLHAESIEELVMLAPFISREITDRMAGELHAESVQDLVMLAPFIRRETAEKILKDFKSTAQ